MKTSENSSTAPSSSVAATANVQPDEGSKRKAVDISGTEPSQKRSKNQRVLGGVPDWVVMGHLVGGEFDRANVAERKLWKARDMAKELTAKLSEAETQKETLAQQMANQRDRANAAINKAMENEDKVTQLNVDLSRAGMERMTLFPHTSYLRNKIDEVEENMNGSAKRLAEGRKLILQRAKAKGIDYRILLDDGEIDPLLKIHPNSN